MKISKVIVIVINELLPISDRGIFEVRAHRTTVEFAESVDVPGFESTLEHTHGAVCFVRCCSCLYVPFEIIRDDNAEVAFLVSGSQECRDVGTAVKHGVCPRVPFP